MLHTTPQYTYVLSHRTGDSVSIFTLSKKQLPCGTRPQPNQILTLFATVREGAKEKVLLSGVYRISTVRTGKGPAELIPEFKGMEGLPHALKKNERGYRIDLEKCDEQEPAPPLVLIPEFLCAGVLQ